MKALTFSAFGSSEVLEYREVPNPTLKPSDILVKIKAIGLNFADIYRRTGKFQPKGAPPFINGMEGAGVVIDANGNNQFKVGDRIAFADVPLANAELVAVPSANVISLPEDISFELASALLLQGLTAQYLAADSYQIKRGETILIHASSGGVGQLLIQIAKLYGAEVIGLTSSESKKGASLSKGADAVFLYENWKESVLQYTNGEGADAVYDSIGNTLNDSLDVTAKGGTIVFYGIAGGEPPLIDPKVLWGGSKTLTTGDLTHYLTSYEERNQRATQLFDWVRLNQLSIESPKIFKLSQGKEAHEYLESRKSTGKILLIP